MSDSMHRSLDAAIERQGEACDWDLRGGSLWLDREEWGVVIDALAAHRDHASKRKAVNSESTSDVRADMCRDLIQRINRAALPAREPRP